MQASARDNARIFQNKIAMRGTVKGNAKVYQVGGDMSWSGIHNHQHGHGNGQDLTKYIFSGRGPGQLLAALGLVIALIAFADLVSLLFIPGALDQDTNSPTSLGGVLPSGIRLGVVHFLGFGVGGAIATIGSSMTRAGARGANTRIHLVIAVAIVVACVVGLDKVLAGAPLSTLTPHFSVQERR